MTLGFEVLLTSKLWKQWHLCLLMMRQISRRGRQLEVPYWSWEKKIKFVINGRGESSSSFGRHLEI